jgi:hypothetical protein
LQFLLPAGPFRQALEGHGQKFAQSPLFSKTTRLRNHDEIRRELREDLTTCAAGAYRPLTIGDDRHRAKAPHALRNRTSHR